jgi:hypothetical protein
MGARLMQISIKKTILRHVASPYGLAAISYAFFLLAWGFPPKVYNRIMSEPDYMFLDLATFSFYGLCFLSFVLGVAYIDILLPRKELALNKIKTKISPFKFLSLPVFIALVICIVSCVLLLREYPLLVAAITSRMGSAVKESGIGLHSPLGLANTWLIGILWWAIWRRNEVIPKGKAASVFNFIFMAGLALCIFMPAIKVSRGELMPTFFGTGVIAILAGQAKGNLRNRHIVISGIILFSILAGIFILFSFIRGSDDLWSTLIGYTIASYNRLSALVQNKFRYPYAGHFVYLCGFLHGNNMLNAVIPLRHLFGWPDFMTLFQSEFKAVASSGLNGNLIWSGTFGYIYSELRWFSVIHVFLLGLLYGYIWNLLKRGNTFGIILYPWFAFCTLFWFGTNYLFDNKCLVLFLAALLLYLYERMISTHAGKSQKHMLNAA